MRLSLWHVFNFGSMQGIKIFTGALYTSSHKHMQVNDVLHLATVYHTHTYNTSLIVWTLF